MRCALLLAMWVTIRTFNPMKRAQEAVTVHERAYKVVRDEACYFRALNLPVVLGWDIYVLEADGRM